MENGLKPPSAKTIPVWPIAHPLMENFFFPDVLKTFKPVEL